MNTKIKIGDEVYTFTKKDRNPIGKREVISIKETKTSKTIEVKPLLDPEYHSKEETLLYDERNCYLDKEEFKQYLLRQRDRDIEEYVAQVNKIYDEHFNNWKIA